MNADHYAHPLGLGVKKRVVQKTANELRRPIIRYIQPNQAVVGIGPDGPVEVAIEAEESRPGEAMKQWKQVFILGARRANFAADDPKSDPSLTQQLLLAVGQIFVEHQH